MADTLNAGEAVPGDFSAAVQRADTLLAHFGQRVREVRTQLEVKAEAEVKEASAQVAAETTSTPPTERASEILDRAGERLGRFASAAALSFRRTAALAREEAEDILAEAQALRQGSSPEAL